MEANQRECGNSAEQTLFLTEEPSAMPGNGFALLKVNGIKPVQAEWFPK